MKFPIRAALIFILSFFLGPGLFLLRTETLASTFATYKGSFAGSTTQTKDYGFFVCIWLHSVSGSGTVTVVGSGPYEATFSFKGQDVITSEDPSWCANDVSPLDETGETIIGADRKINVCLNYDGSVGCYDGEVSEDDSEVFGTLTITSDFFDNPIVGPLILTRTQQCSDNDGDGYFAEADCGTTVDCNDGDGTVKPGAAEICNNVDDNCDEQIDEDLTRATSCGVGACARNTGIETCVAGDWADDTCDPFSGASPETCNGIDDDCDGTTDEGCSLPVDPFTSAGTDIPNLGCVLNSCPASSLTVNAASSNLIYQDTDMSYSLRGPGVRITRTYNSNDTREGPFGRGWTFNYEVGLVENPDSSVDIRRGTGTIHRYASLGGGNYNSPIGVYDTLVKNPDNTYSLKLKASKLTSNFDSSGRLTHISDRNGNSINFQYHTSGNLIGITDAAGRLTTLNYGANGKISSLVDPLGRSVNYSYDANNSLLSITDMGGNVVSYTYDTIGYITSITSAKGTTAITYTTSGNGKVLASITHPSNIVQSYGYFDEGGNANPMVLRETDGNGNYTYHRNNADGYIEKITDALGNAVTYGYDSIGNRTSYQNANGKSTSVTYDASGNVTSITTPLGRITTYEYDGNDNLTRLTGPGSNVVTFDYDSNDNLTSISNPPTTFTYNSYGELASMTDARGNTTAFNYDSEGNLASVTNAREEVPYTYNYDAVGRNIQVTDNSGNSTSYQYDGLDRVIRENFPLGVRQYIYNCCSLTGVINEEGKTTQYTYEPSGGPIPDNLLTVTNALGNVTAYDYDNVGNMIQATNALGNSVIYGYDNSDRLIQDGDGTAYSYDGVGNILARTDSNGNTISYTYDDDSRLTAITYQDSSNVGFSYDNNSNITGVTDSNGTTTYAYVFIAGRDRIVSKTDSFGKNIQYGYDAVGNLTSITYPDGKVVSYSYDELNRLITVMDWLSNTTTYTYAFGNYLGSITYPNGVTTSYGYDSGWRLISMVTRKSDSTIISSHTYTLNKVGNRIGLIKTEPLSASPSLADTSYTYDADNRLISSTGTDLATFNFDNNGNLINKNASSVISTYNYDFENRLTQVSTGGNTMQYAYDELGNRITRTVNGTTTRYVVDTNGVLSQILAERDGSGNIRSYYVYGLGLLSMITLPGNEYYYHYDGLGSTIAMTDSAQNIVNKYAYDPHGKILASVEGVPNSYKFIGLLGIMDEGNDLYFMRARYYDAGIKRFIHKDPLWGDRWDPGSFNRFIYVSNSPVSRVDPLGLYWRYYQHSGRLYHIDIETMKETFVWRGYAGSAEGLNNPGMQDIYKKGPLPRAFYEIGPLVYHKKQKHDVLYLTPLEKISRKGPFMIHGDKRGCMAKHQKCYKTASEGCIIMPGEIRTLIAKSRDNLLIVER